MPIAPSPDVSHLATPADPTRQSDPARRDDALRPEIQRVLKENDRVYGLRKVWPPLLRAGHHLRQAAPDDDP